MRRDGDFACFDSCRTILKLLAQVYPISKSQVLYSLPEQISVVLRLCAYRYRYPHLQEYLGHLIEVHRPLIRISICLHGHRCIQPTQLVVEERSQLL